MTVSEPRICMLTARDFSRRAFRCASYEGEDVLAEIADLDLIPLRSTRTSALRKEIHKRIVWHDFTGKAVSLNIAFQPTNLTRDYDLFIAYLPLSQDLTHIPALRGWKTRCRTSVCWIDEVWAADVPDLRQWLAALDSFDHVVVGFTGTRDAISDAIGRSCHVVPIGVDAIRFTPFLGNPTRVVDILSMGRRRPAVHQACVDFAARANLFYVHDTLNASYSEVNDHRQHRRMLASMVKRSRYFVVAPAKAEAPEGTRGQSEAGLRYYEGSAAGAVMVGQAPDSDSFRMNFDWPDAVVDLNADGSDVAEVLSDLSAHPDRLAEISRRNATQALLRHDWVYRWEMILKIAGLEPGPRLLERKQRLRRISEQATGPIHHVDSHSSAC